MKTTAERTRQVIADNAGCSINQVASDKRLEDLGLDSFDRVEVVLDLEDEFDIEISDKESTKVDTNTVAQIVALVEGKVKS